MPKNPSHNLRKDVDFSANSSAAKLNRLNERVNTITGSLKDVLAHDMSAISDAVGEYSEDKLSFSRQIIMARQGINGLLSVFPEEKKSANQYTVAPSEDQESVHSVARKFFEELKEFSRAIGILLIDGRESIIELMSRDSNPHYLKHFLGQLINIDKTIENIQKAIDPEGHQVIERILKNSSNGTGKNYARRKTDHKPKILELIEAEKTRNAEKQAEAERLEAERMGKAGEEDEKLALFHAAQETKQQGKKKPAKKSSKKKKKKKRLKPNACKPHFKIYDIKFRVFQVREIAHAISDHIKDDQTGDPNISFEQLLNILSQKKRIRELTEEDLTFHLTNLKAKLEFHGIKLEGDFESGGKIPIYYA